MAFTQESEPLTLLKDMLETYWPQYKEVPMPMIIILNPGEEEENVYNRINFENQDQLIIRTSDTPENIKYRGNIAYIDRIHFVDMEFYTLEGRQRMRDIYKAIRSVLLTYKHQLPNWQLIRMLSWQELVNDAFNIWKGVLKIQLENHAVAAEALDGIPPVP